MKTFNKSTLINSGLDFIHTLCNFIVLNLVFLITSLPIITIGASVSALYYVMIKEAKQEFGYLVRPYLKEYKNNFKATTFSFLLFFFTGIILLFNLAFWYAMDNLVSMLIISVLIFASICYLFTFLYAFPLMARFENGIVQTLKNAFYLSLLHKKITFALLFVDAFVISLCVFFSPMKLFMTFLGFAFIAYCKSFLFIQVFDYYETSQLTKDKGVGCQKVL